MSTIRLCAVTLIAALVATSADAATFADLSGGPDLQGYGADPISAGPYAASPVGSGGYGAGSYAPSPYGCPCPTAPGIDRAYAGGAAFGRYPGYGGPADYNGYVAQQGGPGLPGPYAGAGAPFGSEALPSGSPFSGGPEGAPPPALEAPGMAPPPVPPTAFLPNGSGAGLPNGPLQQATFQQVNSTTDPYNAWGLSTPFMFVPWSTPLSGWTNAQTWSWWRERSGASPYGW